MCAIKRTKKREKREKEISNVLDSRSLEIHGVGSKSQKKYKQVKGKVWVFNNG